MVKLEEVVNRVLKILKTLKIEEDDVISLEIMHWYDLPLRIQIEDSTFGDPTVNGSGDLKAYPYVRYYVRNVKLLSSPQVSVGKETKIFVEDLDGVKNKNKLFSYAGTIETNTEVLRADGSETSAEFIPSSNCNVYNPLELCEFGRELSRWLKAGVHGCQMWVRGSAWSTIPTSDELYLEVKYYDSESAKRATIKSTETLQTATVTGETVGTGDGTTTEFSLANRCLQAYTETIYVDGTLQTRDTDYSIDYDTGKITFATAPALDTTITADYTYFKWTQLSVSFDLYSDSPCYANIILKKYESGAKVYVDILPIWS